MEYKILMCYYDVPSGKGQAYNVIYNGVREKGQIKVPGMKHPAIAGLPVNKSVWLVSLDNKNSLDKLKQYVSANYGVSFEYVVVLVDHQSLYKVWSDYKFSFIVKIQKYIDKIKEKKVSDKSIESFFDNTIAHIEGILVAFSIQGEDDPQIRGSIFNALVDLTKEVYPDLKIKKEASYVNN